MLSVNVLGLDKIYFLFVNCKIYLVKVLTEERHFLVFLTINKFSKVYKVLEQYSVMQTLSSETFTYILSFHRTLWAYIWTYFPVLKTRYRELIIQKLNSKVFFSVNIHVSLSTNYTFFNHLLCREKKSLQIKWWKIGR